MSKESFDRSANRILLCLCAGLSVGLFIVWTTEVGWYAYSTSPKGWVYEYQNLLSGSLALTGVGAVIWVALFDDRKKRRQANSYVLGYCQVVKAKFDGWKNSFEKNKDPENLKILCRYIRDMTSADIDMTIYPYLDHNRRINMIYLVDGIKMAQKRVDDLISGIDEAQKNNGTESYAGFEGDCSLILSMMKAISATAKRAINKELPDEIIQMENLQT